MAIAFDVSGPIAMFRRPYTTTSSVSFPFPPPTMVAGLLAGIVGIGNGSDEEATAAQYWNQLQGTRIALSVLNSIAWYASTLNFWNVKNPQQSPHIQVKHQFVKNPCYRIYVHGGLETEVRKHLEAGTFVYTPYLGTAYAIAELRYVGSFPWEPALEQRIAIGSVLPRFPGQSFEVDIKASQGMFKELLPFRMTTDRTLEESVTVFYPVSPSQKIHLTAWEGLDVTHCGDTCIAWFPAW